MKYWLYAGGRDSEIIRLFADAFTDSEGQQEGEQIGMLVSEFLQTTAPEDLRVFVAGEEEKFLGSVIFSKMRFERSSLNVWLLSPAAVATAAQGRGVGQGLIRFAHDILREEGVEAVVTYGDIRFYSKVGYRPIAVEVIPAPYTLLYPEGWIAQSLNGRELLPIEGGVQCVEAISDPRYW